MHRTKFYRTFNYYLSVCTAEDNVSHHRLDDSKLTHVLCSTLANALILIEYVAVTFPSAQPRTMCPAVKQVIDTRTIGVH